MSNRIAASFVVGCAVGLFLAGSLSCGRVSTCGASCAGCCTADGRCREGNAANADTTCGARGSLCVDCSASGATCESGSCRATGDGGTGPCGPNNCQGCCTGATSASLCIARPSQTNCGAGGNLCKSCPAGETCIGGGCVRPDAGFANVGAACTSDLDMKCKGLACRLETAQGNTPYQDGYCSSNCIAAGDCGLTGVCASSLGPYGEPEKICLKRCIDGNDCRPGYACYQLGAEKACWIYPPPFDVGPPADRVGVPCVDTAECRNPPNDGFCIPESSEDGGATGFSGGYCSAACESSSHCSADGGAICVTFDDVNACLRTCPGPGSGQSTCRAGYLCLRLQNSDGGAAPAGICGPGCDVTGCEMRETCLPSGYCK